MRIDVRAVNFGMDDTAAGRIRHRLEASLDRLAHHVRRVRVRLVDQNGPRGGKDVACLVEVRLRAFGRLFVESNDFDALSAASRAADKAEAALTRRLSRRRTRRRRIFPGANPLST